MVVEDRQLGGLGNPHHLDAALCSQSLDQLVRNRDLAASTPTPPLPRWAKESPAFPSGGIVSQPVDEPLKTSSLQTRRPGLGLLVGNKRADLGGDPESGGSAGGEIREREFPRGSQLTQTALGEKFGCDGAAFTIDAYQLQQGREGVRRQITGTQGSRQIEAARHRAAEPPGSSIATNDTEELRFGGERAIGKVSERGRILRRPAETRRLAVVAQAANRWAASRARARTGSRWPPARSHWITDWPRSIFEEDTSQPARVQSST
jgi:hypothetical protein